MQHRGGHAVDGEDVTDEAVVRVVLVEQLAPPLGVDASAELVGREVLALQGGPLERGVLVGVRAHSVVEAAVVERERDVVLHVEGAVAVVGADARQTQTVGLVAAVQHRIVVRREADHALVDVGPRVVHAVIVEPEERLLLAIVAARRICEIQVVDPLPRLVAAAVVGHVVRLAVALGRGVAVVQVGEERPVGSAEVLPVETALVQVEVVLESDQSGASVLDVEHRSREGAVEPVDGAGRQEI